MKIVKSIEELIEVLGIKPGDKIEITGSQHYRDYKLEIDFIPADKMELEAIIATASDENLMKMGVCLWTTYDDEIQDKKPLNEMYLTPGQKHFLFPAEWYDSIPNGFEIIDIYGNKVKFVQGTTDRDSRFGCLSFGFIRDSKQ
ncbi:hypothetical protein ACI6PS_03510 [Flavobacterium sp. PLA-1-15]|uniref:hypothetical protein n=1 Tax=Flavobacterium sp. PLA-1-15 TaxID=3380533 RepID=UPI003B7A99DF